MTTDESSVDLPHVEQTSYLEELHQPKHHDSLSIYTWHER
jgi:hypothetical protein